MTVAELIEELKEYPQDLPVTTWTERSGYDFDINFEVRESTGGTGFHTDHPWVDGKYWVGKYLNIGI